MAFELFLLELTVRDGCWWLLLQSCGSLVYQILGPPPVSGNGIRIYSVLCVHVWKLTSFIPCRLCVGLRHGFSIPVSTLTFRLKCYLYASRKESIYTTCVTRLRLVPQSDGKSERKRPSWKAKRKTPKKYHRIVMRHRVRSKLS